MNEEHQVVLFLMGSFVSIFCKVLDKFTPDIVRADGALITNLIAICTLLFCRKFFGFDIPNMGVLNEVAEVVAYSSGSLLLVGKVQTSIVKNNSTMDRRK